LAWKETKFPGKDFRPNGKEVLIRAKGVANLQQLYAQS
jgi:hypothetical protein